MSKPIQLTVKLGDLVKSEEALNRIASEQCSARMSFTFSLVLRQVGEHLDAMRAARKKLVDQYGRPRENNPEVFDVPKEDRETFRKEFEDLLAAPITLSGIGKIRVSALETEGIRPTGNEVFVLAWLLKNDVEPIFEAVEPEAQPS